MAEPRNPGAGRPLRGIPPLPRSVAVPPRPSAPSRPSAPRAPRPWHLRLVLGPAVISLAVTLVRLVGEIRGWSPEYWSRLPGGGLSLLGIVWLIPVFGFYFGWRLETLGERAPSPLQAGLQPPLVAFLLGGAALLVAHMRASGHMEAVGWSAWLSLWGVIAAIVVGASLLAWPTLGRLLLAYAISARVPVAALMMLAMARDWGTHYDALPPGFPSLPLLPRWLWLGLLPQLTIWVAVTLAAGVPAGTLGALAQAQYTRYRRAR